MTLPTEASAQAPRQSFQPGRLWSLWDMKDWDGPGLSAAQTYLISLCQLMIRARTDNASVPMSGPTVAEFRLNVEMVSRIARAHNLDVLMHACDDLAETLTALRAPDTFEINIDYGLMHQILPRLDHVIRSINHSLRGRVMFALSVEGQRLYEGKEPLFGADVYDKFPKSRDDIAEAGKCLAMRRNKATVFHLMLAMEEALRALALRIGADVYDVAKDQFMPWGQIVGNVKAKLPSLPKDQQEDWLEVHNLLWGVGKAWRNGTMHPAESYTDEQAETVFGGVKGFMQHLAPLI